MKSKKWFIRAIEIGLLGLIIYCITFVFGKFLPPSEYLKTMHSASSPFLTAIAVLAFVKILKRMGYLLPVRIRKLIRRLDQDISILIIFIVVFYFVFYSPSVVPKQLYFSYYMVIKYFNDKQGFLLNPVISLVWIIPLLGLLCILRLILLSMVSMPSGTNFAYIKYNNYVLFVFSISRILNAIIWIVFSVASYSFVVWFFWLLVVGIVAAPQSIIMSINPNLLLEYLNISPELYPFVVQKLPWWTIPYALLQWLFLFLSLAFMAINVWTFLCIGILTILMFLVPVKLKLNVNINRKISNFIWSFVSNLINFIEFISTFLIFSDYLKIAIIDMGLSYALVSDFTPKSQSENLRKLAAKFAQKCLGTKISLFGLDHRKFKLISNIAAKLLFLGDLKKADIIYSVLWESARNQTESGKVLPNFIKNRLVIRNFIHNIFNIFAVPNFIDNVFSEVCYYYIETSQYELLNLVINDSATLVKKNQLSELTYITNKMRADFAKNVYSEQADKDVDKCLSWEKIFTILVGLPDILNYSHNANILWTAKAFWMAEAPEDFFKLVLGWIKDFKDFELIFIEDNQKDLICLLETLRLIFVTQSKIYRFISTQDFESIPTQTEIAATLIKQQSLNISSMKISVDNSFAKDNVKLITVVYLLASDYKSVNLLGNQRLEVGSEELLKKILKESIESAKKNGREMELAFLQCCQGKILINTGCAEDGFHTLLRGIETYEGIRHSVSTDQLGLGFGSSYLEYYDWAIDALIQLENLSLAFEYTERATARAILDLVSRKTSRLGSINESNQVAQLIGEIQNLDFTIYFSQSSIYEPPFIAKFPPLKPRLEKKFYTDKKQRLKHLLKNRDSLVAKLKGKDSVSATLVEVKPLTWKTSSESEENSIPFDALWNSQTIAETETILCFHVIHKLSFAKNKPWDKIVCFAMYNENGSLQLHHHVVDDPETVAKLQPLCQGIASEVEKRNLNLKTNSLDPLSNNLIIPLLQHLPICCNSLTIVANSDLQFFPWSILYDRDDKQLIERFRIRTTPSLSLMYLLKQREDFRHTDSPTKFLVAGVEQYPNPREYLFWCGVEINRISQLYDSASVLKDADVDEHFANQFKQAEVIHYSGHGNYRKSDSGRDALDKTYLCLYNKEISATQILDGALENPAAKVMILSACLTGQGDLTRSGSEILGLERALFHAGLSSLVTTLWSVDDFATALLMFKLHLVWRQQNNSLETLAESLREAQLWLKNLSWQKLKQECPEIERDVYNCLATYQTRITCARANEDEDLARKFENDLEYYQNALKRLQSESSRRIFIYDYFWAAFQVKGLG
ncbi:CHAT domain-containing protein [Tychonema sp. BBK16]|uniref:CHAT domain-containing protein n=1 Tax=Tychonema sp. BBK16 TaxID=2699888 RepID=UPI001F3B6BFD|nr:CHAT domain-containing protein [Tychonema sp. BBK16]MCF6372734.1 CHAT domain-containing protein [Tychonema sp. BBK16]